MKKKILSVFLLSALVLTLFAGCGKQAATQGSIRINIDPEDAYVIIQEALGIDEENFLSPETHYGTYGDPPEACYSVMFATREKDYTFIISAIDGEIMYRSDEAEQ